MVALAGFLGEANLEDAESSGNGSGVVGYSLGVVSEDLEVAFGGELPNVESSWRLGDDHGENLPGSGVSCRQEEARHLPTAKKNSSLLFLNPRPSSRRESFFALLFILLFSAECLGFALS